MVPRTSRTIEHHDQVEHNPFGLSQYDMRLRVLELTVQVLIARAHMYDHWAAGFQEARNLLAALPLPTAEFALLSRHLQNAVGYGEVQEYGAAAFELRVVRGQLQRL